MTLDDLIVRLEAASKGSPELDAAISLAVHPAPPGQSQHYNPYSTSIDAAMRLIPEGWLLITLSDIKADGMPLCVLGRPGDAAMAEGISDHDKVFALCIAALRARNAAHD